MGGELERRVVGYSFQDIDTYIQALLDEVCHLDPQETLVSYGFDEERWGLSKIDFEKKLRAALDPSRKWILYRVCGHSAVCSEAFLEALGLIRSGGMLDDKGIHAIQERLPPPSIEALKQDFLRAQRKLLEAGINAVGDMSLDAYLVQAVVELHDEGLLELDYQGVMLDEPKSGGVLASPLFKHNSQRRFEIRHWKRYLDGSFGSRTAWLRDPYADEAQERGLQLYESKELIEAARAALAKGFALSFHAIGDAALEQIIELSGALKNEMQLANTQAGFRVHRIEHAQLMGDDQLRRLVELDLWTLCMQPYHRVADSIFINKRLGATRAGAQSYRLGSLIIAGLDVSLGSDAPITVFDPIQILESVSSHTTDSERLGFADALWTYSEGGRCVHGLPLRQIDVNHRVWLLEPRATHV
jgi:predicted amidohydrolase YtcJ